MTNSSKDIQGLFSSIFCDLFPVLDLSFLFVLVVKVPLGDLSPRLAKRDHIKTHKDLETAPDFMAVVMIVPSDSVCES